MAKRKSKKNNNSVLLRLIASFLGFATLAVLLLPVITGEKTEITYTGAQIAFGYAEETLLGSAKIFDFSFMNFLPYLLAIAGTTLAIFAGLKESKLFAFLAGAMFIIQGVLFLLSVKVCVPANITNETLINTFKDGFNLAYGAIIGAIVAFIAGLCSVVSSFVKK